MDTKQFFQTVLPSAGIKFVAEFAPIADHPRGGVFFHHPFEDVDAMVDKVLKIDAKGKNVAYHACATYKEVIYKTSPKGKQYAAGRTQVNAKHAKAIWQDFDVNKMDDEGNLKSFSYATRDEALQAVKLMAKSTGFGTPLLVSSGNGLHAYWPFTEEVTATEWSCLATKVRQIMQHLGVKFDASRDQDVASILRPPGTHNNGKLVKVVCNGGVKDFEELNDLADKYLAANGIEPELRAAPTDKFENEFGKVEQDFPPSSLEVISTLCKQVEEFRNTGGVSEPVWYANLGLAKHCTDGEKLAHEWGANYVGYDRAETDLKMSQWIYGPTTCSKFQSLNCGGCTDCPFMGKIKSPIQLGYKVETTPPVVAATPNNPQPSSPPGWPDRFRVSNGQIQMMVPDRDTGVVTPIKVAEPLFYITERIRGDDGTFLYRIRMQVRANQWREFEMPAKVRAETRTLKSFLSAYEITVYNDKLLEIFMTDYANKVRNMFDEKNTFIQFGWNEDMTGFVIGDRMVTKGFTTEVRISRDNIKDRKLLRAFSVKGTKEQWRDGVMKLYGEENGLPYQYAICAQLGAPLVPLMELKDWNGIPMALTSDNSGYGKSTVVTIGINFFCDSAVTTVSDTTSKAVIGRASIMKNLPVLFDEVTKSLKDSEGMSDILYSLSNGRPRIGMQSDGKEREPLPDFKLNSTMTGNKNILFQLTESKTNPEATQMRVFEISLDDYPKLEAVNKKSKKHAEHHELAAYLASHVHGIGAQEYFDFVVPHKEKITEKLLSVATSIKNELGGEAAKERFYANHIACTLIGGWIAQKLGYHDFDLKALKRWAVNHVMKLRSASENYAYTVEDRLSQFLSTLHGNILVTRNYDLLDSRQGKTEVPMITLRGDIQARLALGSDKERGKLYVSVHALDEWCKKQGISPVMFRRQMLGNGLIRALPNQSKNLDARIYLSKGVPTYPTGQCRCLEIDFDVAQGYIKEHVHTDNVVELKGKPVTNSVTNNSVDMADAAVSY